MLRQSYFWGPTQSYKGNKTFSKSEEWDSLFSLKIVLLRFLRSEHKKTYSKILNLYRCIVVKK